MSKVILISILLVLAFCNISTREQFGKHLLKHFYLDPNYTNVNHGSYGAPPRQVIAKLRSYQEQMDYSPEKWIRSTMYKKLNETREIVSKYINADSDNVVLVENASDGVNSIFKSILTIPGEKVLIFDIAYIMVQKVLEYLHDHNKIETVRLVLDEITINSDDKIIHKLEEIIHTEGPFKFASIDHISSVPGVILPVKRIVELLRQHNILSFIDGAHTYGQIPLNITDINPDFYISNCHKWGYVPKSVTLLYVRKELQDKIHPNIITFKYNTGYLNEYSYTGTKDYSVFYTIKDALEFREELGEDDIMNYMNSLAYDSGNLVSEIWDTEVLIADKHRMGAMVNVRIPSQDESVILKAVDYTMRDCNIFIVVYRFNNGIFYARFSAQIYNEISDYRYAATCFLDVLKRLSISLEDL